MSGETGTNDVPSGETRPDISIGRGDALVEPPARAEEEGHGHPLPASEKARYGSVPEGVEQAKGHGAN